MNLKAKPGKGNLIIGWNYVWIVALLVLLSLILMYRCGHAQNIRNPLYGYVSDFAQVLDQKSIKEMNAKIGVVKDLVEIAVVTVSDLQGYDVETFTHTLATKWGVGKKGKDNGIVILIAIKERKVRIEVGYGMEPIIPDSIAKRIIELDMKPYLKKNDFNGGLSAGVDAIIKRIREKGK